MEVTLERSSLARERRGFLAAAAREVSRAHERREEEDRRDLEREEVAPALVRGRDEQGPDFRRGPGEGRGVERARRRREVSAREGSRRRGRERRAAGNP